MEQIVPGFLRGRVQYPVVAQAHPVLFVVLMRSRGKEVGPKIVSVRVTTDRMTAEINLSRRKSYSKPFMRTGRRRAGIRNDLEKKRPPPASGKRRRKKAVRSKRRGKVPKLKKDQFGPDDPVRTYLRTMSSVPLLSHDEEVEIGRQMDPKIQKEYGGLYPNSDVRELMQEGRGKWEKSRYSL